MISITWPLRVVVIGLCFFHSLSRSPFFLFFIFDCPKDHDPEHVISSCTTARKGIFGDLWHCTQPEPPISSSFSL